MSHTATEDGEVEEMVGLLRRLGERDALPSGTAERTELFGRAVLGIPLGCPWYTGTPLSTVEELAVALDGVSVPADRVFFGLRDQVFSAWTLQSVYEIWWGMGEAGTLLIAIDGDPALQAFRSGALVVTLRLRSAMSYGLPGDVVVYSFRRDIEVSS